MKAILLVSVGTATQQVGEHVLDTLEERILEGMPGWTLYTAYTSGPIRRILERRGIYLDSPEQALEKLIKEGISQVVVQPTHLIPGEEFDGLKQLLWRYQGQFSSLRLGMPLLSSQEDCIRVAQLLAQQFPFHARQCVLFMGHGTSHPAQRFYLHVARQFSLLGRPDIQVGTMKGAPGLAQLLPQIQQAGFHRVQLAPLMLMAGRHVLRDMTGGPDSWQARLEQAGLTVFPVLRGLGELPGIQEIYLDHLRTAVPLSMALR